MKKFIESIDVNDWQVDTDTGWKDIKKIYKTIKYQEWVLETNNYKLICADNHIIFDENFNEKYVKDLKIGDKIQTKNGIEKINYIYSTEKYSNMYDLEIDSNDHRYYTNGILSHNTQTAICYLIWYAMANPFKTIIITSFGDDSARKNLSDAKFIYEHCPDFLKNGIVRMNESTILFDNGSKIISKPTTGKSVRGNTPSIIYCDEFAFVGTVGGSSKINLQEEFYTAVSPALAASKGKICITSTPISETDVFYHLWSGAIDKKDDKGIDLPKTYMISINNELYKDFHLFKTKEEGLNYLKSINNPKGWEIVEKESVGNNGFISQLTTWEKCPDRNEEWKNLEIKKIGLSKFNQEYCCISGDNILNILDENNNQLNIPIELLYKYHMK